MDENKIEAEALEPCEDEETGLAEIEADGAGFAVAMLISGGVAAGIGLKTVYDRHLAPRINSWRMRRAAKKAEKNADGDDIIDVEARPAEEGKETA